MFLFISRFYDSGATEYDYMRVDSSYEVSVKKRIGRCLVFEEIVPSMDDVNLLIDEFGV